MVAKRRIRKHDLKEDRFVTTTFRLTSVVRENQNTFLTILAALVVLVIVIVVVTSSRSRSHEGAARLLGQANMLYQAGHFHEAIQQCQSVLDQHGNTQEAGQAAFFLADSYLKLGDYQNALDAFTLYVNRYHQDRLLMASSLTAIASCYEQLGQFSSAGEFYMKSAREYPEFFGTPESLMNAGRCFAHAGDLDAAIDSYTRVVEDFSESSYFTDAKMLIAELKTMSD